MAHEPGIQKLSHMNVSILIATVGKVASSIVFVPKLLT